MFQILQGIRNKVCKNNSMGFLYDFQEPIKNISCAYHSGVVCCVFFFGGGGFLLLFVLLLHPLGNKVLP